MQSANKENELLGVAAFFWVGAGSLFALLASARVFTLPFQGWDAVALIFGWLAVGLLFAVAGVARGGTVGRVLSCIALGLWLVTAWSLLFPQYQRMSLGPNQSGQPTPVERLFACSDPAARRGSARR